MAAAVDASQSVAAAPATFWINGETTTTIALTDRGLHYGDGLFTTLAIRHGEPLLWSHHWQRLLAGCHQLQIPPPAPQPLLQALRQLAVGRSRAVVKLILTRGSGGRGYLPPLSVTISRIVACYPWPNYPVTNWRDGVRLHWCRTRVGRSSPALAGLKHLNRLEQVIARAEWRDPTLAEGVMCDQQGRVIEGTMSNLLLLRGDELLTPSLQQSGVRGVMRDQLLQLATTLGLTIRKQSLLPSALLSGDELMICNSVIGLWPVRELAGVSLPVGALSRQLLPRLRRHERQSVAELPAT